MNNEKPLLPSFGINRTITVGTIGPGLSSVPVITGSTSPGHRDLSFLPGNNRRGYLFSDFGRREIISGVVINEWSVGWSCDESNGFPLPASQKNLLSILL